MHGRDFAAFRSKRFNYHVYEVLLPGTPVDIKYVLLGFFGRHAMATLHSQNQYQFTSLMVHLLVLVP